MLQIGNFSVQMFLQVRKGVSRLRCIKCNLHQNRTKILEYPSSNSHTRQFHNQRCSDQNLVSKTINALENILRWYSHPSHQLLNLYCEWSAVKNNILQILSIESGSKKELKKRIIIMDIIGNIEGDKKSMETVQTNLDMNLQRISLERRSLMRDPA